MWADNCPKQKRTLEACARVLEYARENPQILDQLLRSGRLPIGELAAGTGTDRKTMERHRKLFGGDPVSFYKWL